jgi:hypothetical protein
MELGVIKRRMSLQRQRRENVGAWGNAPGYWPTGLESAEGAK